MTVIVVPSWTDLERVFATARQALFIASPFYKKAGLERMLSTDARGIDFICRLSPGDWADRISDPDALSDVLEMLEDDGRQVRLRIQPRLHAKLYVADRSTALLSSANLTEGGFGGNIELAVELNGAVAADAQDLLTSGGQGRSLSVHDLGEWIQQAWSSIASSRRRKDESSSADELATAQAALDDLLGFGQSKSGRARIPSLRSARDVSDYWDYVRWLEGHADLPGAGLLVERARNLNGQNLTGHTRQCFFAVAHFLGDHPEYIAALRQWLEQAGSDDIYQPEPPIAADWIDHLDDCALQEGSGYSYPTIRGILPPGVGGTRSNGGGGISTLKRTFPLVAEYSSD